MRKLAQRLLLLATLAPAVAGAAEGCVAEIASAEARYHLPSGLLMSMAVVESGRLASDGTVAPWPWTIRAQGESRYFDNSEDAQRDSRRSLAAGDALIDVGCLQIDLFHHPKAFPSLAAAFEPHRNVDYAAHYLADLAKSRGSWLEAVAAYNAGRPADGLDYLSRVLYLWRGVKLTSRATSIAGSTWANLPQPLDAAARFFAAKDYAAAALIYADVLRHQPDDPTALTGSGEVLLAQGKPNAARDYFERALMRAQGGNPAALAGLLRAIDSLLPDQVPTALLSAREAAPNAPEIPARLAKLQIETGDFAQAVDNLRTAARLAPQDPMRRLDYALLLDKTGQVHPAIAAYSAFLTAYRGEGSDSVPVDGIRRRVAYLQMHAP